MTERIDKEMDINLRDYSYTLPEARIAKFPITERSESRLLVYKKGEIIHSNFKQILDYIPTHSLLIFNDTKVIPARIIFSRETGAKIEVFCLEPYDSKDKYYEYFNQKNSIFWKCLVGNRRKWKKNEVLVLKKHLKGQEVVLNARLDKQDNNNFVIKFEWTGGLTFGEILDHFGNTPIPPYLNREAEALDTIKYQTVYAKVNGAVAAPTAGLHFTEEMLDQLPSLNINRDFVTLHVSSGTFQPIKVKDLLDHPMHGEKLIFTRKNIENLLDHHDNIICVGTTSLRALESLYWYGVLLQQKTVYKVDFKIDKLLPYTFKRTDKLPDKRKSLELVLEYLKENNFESIQGQTSLFVFPGYNFRMCDGLITNYHMPKSTLILLVAAFVGEDWRLIYHEALKNNYRFLSYGDSSLILPR